MRKQIIKLTRPYRWEIVGSALLLLLCSSLGLLLPLAMKVVIDDVLPNKNVSYLLWIVGTLLLVYAVRMVTFYYSHFYVFRISQNILLDLRIKLIEHVQQLSIRFHENFRTGRLIASIISDIGKIQGMFNQGLMNLFTNSLNAICIITFLFLMDWKLAILSVTILPLYALSFIYFKKTVRLGSQKLQEKVSETSANLSEVLYGIRVVKSFGTESKENRRFRTDFRDMFDLTLNLQTRNVFCSLVADGIGGFGLIMIIAAGSWRVWEGEMTLGAFVSFYAYLGMMYGPIKDLTNMAPIFAEGLTGLSRVTHILNRVPEIEGGQENLKPDEARGKLCFSQVTFDYGSQPFLNNFNLEIESGSTTAFVGPSGSGKSTIATLLLRFYDPHRGQITIGGKDLRELRMESLRKHIGVVLQEPVLFSGTIAENIAYSKVGATMEEIISAAKSAHALEFIDKLRDGFQSEVGEKGGKLSGGQKQRIAIARTLLKSPSILILDEATSALDSQSELEVQKALKAMMKKRTTLIIAHRLSTIRHADKIVVMDSGKIVEQGTHSELLKKGGLYKKLYLISSNEEGPDPQADEARA